MRQHLVKVLRIVAGWLEQGGDPMEAAAFLRRWADIIEDDG